MFLDQYLNESNDMMISSMSPILSESDIEELKNTEDDNVQELYECFTDNEVETMILIESAELLYESKVNDAIKKAYNRMMLMIDKLIAKIKAFINQMRSKAYLKKAEKLYSFIKANIDKLPKDYEFKSPYSFYVDNDIEKIIDITNNIVKIIANIENKSEDDIEEAYKKEGYDGSEDFYKNFGPEIKSGADNITDYNDAIILVKDDNLAKSNIDFYEETLKINTTGKINLQILMRKKLFDNKVARTAAAHHIKLSNLEEFCIRSNINDIMALYKDMYNKIKANM